jgi:hypothetical protein
MIFEFVRRTHRNLQEAMKFSVAFATASFGDIGCNRHGTPPYLRHKPKDLLAGKTASYFVTGKSHAVSFVPDFQIPKIFHRARPFRAEC